jgi:hypothetical protein
VILFAFVDRIVTSVIPEFDPPKPRPKRRSGKRPPRRARWRSGVAWYALLTLAWPSLGALPWVGVDFTAAEHATARQIAHSDANESSAADHHHDGDPSAIPGSPTHPADHDCFPCQMLKHLSRCVPSALDPPTIPRLSDCQAQPRRQLESQIAGHIAALPPVRGPPLSIA